MRGSLPYLNGCKQNQDGAQRFWLWAMLTWPKVLELFLVKIRYLECVHGELETSTSQRQYGHVACVGARMSFRILC